MQYKSIEAANKSIAAANKLVENILKLENNRNNVNRSTTSTNTTCFESTSDITPSNTCISNQNNISNNDTITNNALISVIQKSMENSNKSLIDINRVYKLNNKTSFNLWYDYLISEIKSFHLYDVIDPSVNNKNYSREEKENRDASVRDIIINRLNEFYHKQIAHLHDPRLIIKNLREFKKMETNLSGTVIRQRLYGIKMKPKEKASDFINRFESIIRLSQNIDGAIPLKEEDIRPAFYTAINSVVTDVRSASIVYKQMNNKEMSYQQLKEALLQFHSDKKIDTYNDVNIKTEEPAKANFTNTKSLNNKQNLKKCFRCS